MADASSTKSSTALANASDPGAAFIILAAALSAAAFTAPAKAVPPMRPGVYGIIGAMPGGRQLAL